MRTLICSLLFVFSISFLNAQLYHQGQCGTMPDDDFIARLLENKEAARLMDHNRNDSILYVPVQLHLVADDDGLGRMREKNAVQGLCKLNQDFASLNMVFYLTEEFNYIDMEAMFNLDFPGVSASVNSAYIANKVPNAINIYVGNGLSSGNSGYYSGWLDIIYMDKSYMTQQHGILAHELGHFFSLPHTFLGWESTDYDPTQPTPLQVGGNLVEYVDRDKNCDFAGDYFCGTPADYITSGASNCNYTGGAVDPDSVLIDPDERNHMAYYSFSGCPEYYYSDDQKDVILADYASRVDMSGLDCPELKEVTETATLNFPINHELIETFNSVDFDWEPVPNADFYLIEISPLASFAFIFDYAVIKSTEFTSTKLSANRENYYWRIWAFSQTDFCEIVYSDSGHFATGDIETNTAEIDFLNEISINPNPTSGANALLQFNSSKLERVNISITNTQGKILQSIDNKSITPGNNQIELPTNFLPDGLYFVNIQSNKQIITKRLVVL